MCRHACPVSEATGHETFTPQAKMNQLNQLHRGNTPWSRNATETLWACTGCRLCSEYCEHDNRPGEVLFAGRAAANTRGMGHPKLANYPDRFRNRDERLVASARAELPRDRMSSDAVVGFWPGCDAIDKSIVDVQTALDLVDSLGAEHVAVVDAGQACGGYPLLAAGYPDMFRWHASRVATSLRRFRTVVVNCSACVYAMRVLYPAESVPVTPDILSMAEYLTGLLAGKKLDNRRRTVYYHDPCYLARYANVIDEPRRALAAVAEVREFSWSKRDAECCGGAGLLPKTMPDVADGMAKRRLREVANRGGGTVVTSCGTCTFMLKGNTPSSVDVIDLPSFIATALREQ